ncbi:MAG: hypothetical protein ACOZCL_16895 [Bacillota bacterium]
MFNEHNYLLQVGHAAAARIGIQAVISLGCGVNGRSSEEII